MVDDLTEDDSGLSMRLSVEASYDKDTEVIFHKDKGVPASRLVEVIDRAKAVGLTKLTIQ